METEAKAKVVAFIWGAKFIQFLAALAVFPRSIKEKDEFNLVFQIDQGKAASAARNWTNSAPQADAMTFAFASVSPLLLWVKYSTILQVLPSIKRSTENLVDGLEVPVAPAAKVKGKISVIRVIN